MSTPEKIILAPTDFTEISYNAVHHGATLAKMVNAKLCLLHVFSDDSKSYVKKDGRKLSDIESLLSEKSKALASKFEIEVNYLVKEGRLFATIEQTALELNSMLLVLGTHGKSGIQHLTGSYALKVVTNSPTPVIVFQQKAAEHGFKDIVFPVSDSAYVRQKVKWAVSIAKVFNSRIHLFRIKGGSQESDNKIRLISSQIKESFMSSGVAFVESVSDSTSNFAEQVLYYASANKTDLIMIMTQKNEFAPAFFLGPWDEKMIFNHSQIPVMCINPYETSTFYFR